jgi:transposase-like protein
MSEPVTLKTLAEVEAEHIRTVYQSTGGNMAATARILGIDRRTLYRKAPKIELGPGLGIPGRRPKNVLYLQNRVIELEQRLAKHEGVGPKP